MMRITLRYVALDGLPLEVRREMDQLSEKDKLFEGTLKANNQIIIV